MSEWIATERVVAGKWAGSCTSPQSDVLFVADVRGVGNNEVREREIHVTSIMKSCCLEMRFVLNLLNT
jgi:hypothetical protein